MKWRHWAVLIVLVLLNYIIFSTAFTQLAEQRRPRARPTRTLQPTFASVESNPISWIIVDTSTPRPSRTPVTPSPTPTPTVAVTVPVSATSHIVVADTTVVATPTPSLTPPPSPRPPSATPAAGATVHTVSRGETLSGIAKQYGVSVQAIMDANGLADANHIVTGQKLVIPAPGQTVASATPRPVQPTNTRAPAKTPQPTSTPTRAAAAQQFTAQLIWDPAIAPNCAGPGVSKKSIIKDTAGNPVNGVRVEVDCYGNKFPSHPSGNPGEYDPGHYDFSFGQDSPQDWTCTAQVLDLNGQPVASSQVVSIHFDLNDCRPNGSGHQVAILNWVKNW